MKKRNRCLKQKTAGSSPSPIHDDRKHCGKIITILDQENQDPKVKDLNKNQRSQLSTHRKTSDEAGNPFQKDVKRLKAQKVQLLCKIKLDSVQFRLSKASLEKEVLQLKKEQMRTAYEMRKLIALNQKQGQVLQRKTEEASLATKRFNELLASRKASSSAQNSIKHGIQGIEREHEVSVRVQEIRAEYDRQMEEMAEEVRNYEEEAEMLKEENSRFLLKEKEVECRVSDSELKDLKDEIFRLSGIISHLETLEHPFVQKLEVKQSSVDIHSGPESLDKSGPALEYSSGINGAFEKPKPRICCSCTKKSLCKTSKCGCLAAGSICGASCGCAMSKCTNRKAISTKADGSSSVPEMVENLVKNTGIFPVENDAVASQGVILLPNIVEQKFDKDENCRPTKKPLSDIGNIVVNKEVNIRAAKLGQKNKGKKPVKKQEPCLPPQNREATETAVNSNV